jgi:hypothetical protein
MTFLSFSLAFGLLAARHEVLDSNFKLCAFVVNGLIKGEIEKPSGQFLRLNSNLGQDRVVLPLLHFVWRIVFACLMVCRWQVWLGVQR